MNMILVNQFPQIQQYIKQTIVSPASVKLIRVLIKQSKQDEDYCVCCATTAIASCSLSSNQYDLCTSLYSKCYSQ